MKKIYIISLLLCSVTVFSQSTNKSALCKNIDKLEKEEITYFFTPATERISIVKTISKADTSYYLKVNTTGNIIVKEPKGVFILMENSKSIENEEAEITVEANDDKLYDGKPYLYSTMIKIEPIDVVHLSIYRILGFKSYIFEGNLAKEESEILNQYAMCIF